jgi:hypothetical protein
MLCVAFVQPDNLDVTTSGGLTRAGLLFIVLLEFSVLKGK